MVIISLNEKVRTKESIREIKETEKLPASGLISLLEK